MGLAIYLASETSFCIISGALWKRQYTKLHVIIIVWPLAVPGGVYCAFHAKSVPEVYLACIPLPLVIGIVFCFLGGSFLWVRTAGHFVPGQSDILQSNDHNKQRITD